MKTLPLTHFNKPALWGLTMITIPLLFWISVINEQWLGMTWLVENIFVPMDKSFQFLSPLLLLIIPTVALLWNLKQISRFELSRSITEIKCSYSIKPNWSNIIIILFGIFNALALMAYLLSENFEITIR